MKVISKKLIKKKNHIQYMRSEKAILTKVVHPFVVSLKFAFQSDKKLFLVMSFLGGGELFFHLKRRGLIREHEARFYAGEMILAIDFLHSMGIVHRDLKPENVLLDWEGHVTLTDFGLAKEIGEGADVRTLCGTSEYMAPEMLVRNGYGKAVDWWSLGALLFEMLAGQPPFTAGKGGQKELDRKIISERLSCPPHLTATAHSLLKSLLEKDPSKRLGCAKGTMFNIGGVTALKNHDFFRGICWDSLLKKTHGPPPIAVNAGGSDDPGDDTSHFHEGFTSQCLSPSVVEDSLTPGERTPTSAPSRSRGSSFEGAFDDFAYSVPGELVVTRRELEQFELALQEKVRAQQKKQKKRAKGEEVRAARAVQEQKQREQLGAQKEQQAREEQRRRALDVLRGEQRLEAEKRHGALRGQRARCEGVLVSVQAAEGALEEHQKKVKRLTKKLKEIQQLAEKGRTGSLSAEQRLKLQRQQEVEDDLAEAEEEEEGAAAALESVRAEQVRELGALEQLQRELEALLLKQQVQIAEVAGGGEVAICASPLLQQEHEQKQKQKDAGVAVVGHEAATGGTADSASLEVRDALISVTAPVAAKAKSKVTPVDDVWETVPVSKKGQQRKR